MTYSLSSILNESVVNKVSLAINLYLNIVYFTFKR